jgi:hypothetical protein
VIGGISNAPHFFRWFDARLRAGRTKSGSSRKTVMLIALVTVTIALVTVTIALDDQDRS